MHLLEFLEAGVDLNGLSDCSAAYLAEIVGAQARKAGKQALDGSSA